MFLPEPVSHLGVKNASCEINYSMPRLWIKVIGKYYSHLVHVKHNPDGVERLRDLQVDQTPGTCVFNSAYDQSRLDAQNVTRRHSTYPEAHYEYMKLRNLYLHKPDRDEEGAIQKWRYYAISTEKKKKEKTPGSGQRCKEDSLAYQKERSLL